MEEKAMSAVTMNDIDAFDKGLAAAAAAATEAAAAGEPELASPTAITGW